MYICIRRKMFPIPLIYAEIGGARCLKLRNYSYIEVTFELMNLLLYLIRRPIMCTQVYYVCLVVIGRSKLKTSLFIKIYAF